MRKLARAAAVTAAAALAVGVMPAASHANQGNDTKNEQGAQTQQHATETFVDIVPCASDTGFFEITITFNSGDRFTGDGGHFTATGTFSAVPVTVTEFEQVPHDDHFHDVPSAWESREAATYSGRFTSSGTMNNNPNAGAESFNFHLKGTSSEGESVSAQGVYHRITSNGEPRTLLERETCS